MADMGCFPIRWHHIDGLMQERRNSSALAMELRLSCTIPINIKLAVISNFPGQSTNWSIGCFGVHQRNNESSVYITDLLCGESTHLHVSLHRKPIIQIGLSWHPLLMSLSSFSPWRDHSWQGDLVAYARWRVGVRTISESARYRGLT